jgi:hypothetical protein
VLVAKAANQSAGKSILPFLKRQSHEIFFLKFLFVELISNPVKLWLFPGNIPSPFYISSGFVIKD